MQHLFTSRIRKGNISKFEQVPFPFCFCIADTLHIRTHSQHLRNTVEPRERDLPRRPNLRQLPKRKVKILHIQQKSDEQPDSERTLLNEVYSGKKGEKLRSLACKRINRSS